MLMAVAPTSTVVGSLSSNMTIAAASIACLAVFGIVQMLLQRRKVEQREQNFVEFPNYGRIDIDEDPSARQWFGYTSLAGGVNDGKAAHFVDRQAAHSGFFVNDDDIYTDSDEDDDSGGLLGRVVDQIRRQNRGLLRDQQTHEETLANASVPSFTTVDHAWTHTNYRPEDIISV